jgi:hypothetical protein
MLPHRCLSSIPGLAPAEVYPDTWMATRPRGLGIYLITSHDRGSAWKPDFLRMLRRFERETGGSDFYRFRAPWALLAWEEHNHYAFSTLGAGETPELFLTEDPWERVVERSARAQADGASRAGRVALRGKLERFRELYAAACDPEPMLGAIASRALDHFDEEISTL